MIKDAVKGTKKEVPAAGTGIKKAQAKPEGTEGGAPQ
jgi:hypothetical protein